MFLELTGFPLIVVSILAFIIIIGAIICIHEAGHYFVAKKCGILCHEYSIGMGPALYKKQGVETTFCVRAIPIGGFVSMAGEQDTADYTKIGNKLGLRLDNDIVTEIILDEKIECDIRGEVTDKDLDGKDGKDLYITIADDMGETHYYQVKEDAKYIFEKGETLQLAPYNRVFDSKPKWQRFLVLFAGAFMNFVLALVLYLIIAFATGVPNLKSNKVGSVSSDFPASEIISKGDKIEEVNGKKISSWKDFQKALKETYDSYGTTIDITFTHKGEVKTASLETYTGIISIGLTNYGAENFKWTNVPGYTDVFGLEVGKVGIRYSMAEGNLSKGDYITGLSIGGADYSFESWSDIIRIFDTLEVKTSLDVRFEYYHKNDDNTYTKVSKGECKSIEPYTDEVLSNQRVEKIQQYIGVSPTYHFSLFKCIGQAFVNFWNDFTLIFRTLKLLIAPQSVRQIGVSDLSSVVGIWGMVKEYIGAGFLALLSLTALLSVNIGVMNLLPIPALDGGRILFLLIEAITGKRPSKKVENAITLVFMALLLILFVYVTFNDILRIFH